MTKRSIFGLGGTFDSVGMSILVVLGVSVVGCDSLFRDPGSVELQDVGSVRDADPGPMDVGGDIGVDGDGTDVCDPVVPTAGCSDGTFCTVVLSSGEPRPGCVEAKGQTREEGAPCGGDTGRLCAPGTICRNWRRQLDAGAICSPLCDRSSDTGMGCGDTADACADPFESELLDHVRVCQP